MAGWDEYTKLLIHFNGTDGAQIYTAETGQIVSFVNTAQLDTEFKKFGTASLLLDGNSDYITVPDSDDWSFGAGNFTIDCWVRVKNVTSKHPVYEQYIDDGNHIRLYLELINANTQYIQMAVWSGGTIRFYGYTNGLANILLVDTWHHIEWTRSGDTNYLFVDGVAIAFVEATAWNGSVPDLAVDPRIGHIATWYLNGSLDELRVSKGIARHTANFDVPTEEYTPPQEAYPTSRLNKKVITGYHCFMNQYIRAKRRDDIPLKLPDGTVF